MSIRSTTSVAKITNRGQKSTLSQHGWLAFSVTSLGSLLFLAALGNPSFGQQNEQDSLDRDYAKELPRIEPLSPTDAMSRFEVASGYRIEQVAAEPLLTDPVAMAFDGDGRLYVVEMRDYSEHPDEHLGRVRLLIDTDEDGKFDESHLFADKLSWPVAITCFDGGVFVGAPPHLYFLRDDDGDFKADKTDIVLTGFGRGNVQGLMNSLHWGLDQKIHGATSSSGAALQVPTAPESEAMVLRGRDFAFNPRTLELSATSGGGQHGMDFNRWGEKFICSNSNHLQFVHFEDRYLLNNPFLAAPGPSHSIASDGPQADVFRASPVEPWRIVRTRLRKQGIVPGPVEGGGTAAGYFTGATGVTVFEGTAWPTQEFDWAIIGDVGSNLIHRKQLLRDGNSYRGNRVDVASEFVRSQDIWFRPVQFANAPDGALYILDMYREVIEHPASLPPLIKKHLDLDSGREKGRLYRVVSDSFKQPALPRLEQASTADLVRTLMHPNAWHRKTANRLLWERQDPTAIDLLRAALETSPTPAAWVTLLSALAGQNALDESVLLAAMEHEHPQVRKWGVRWTEQLESPSVPVERRLLSLADDPELIVRCQVAFTLGSRQGAAVHDALARIATRDYGDPTTRIAVSSALGHGAAPVFTALINDDRAFASDTGKTWLNALASQMLRQQKSDELVAVLALIQDARARSPERFEYLLQTFTVEASHSWFEEIQTSIGADATEQMSKVLAQATVDANNDSLPLDKRLAAITRLRLGQLPEVHELLLGQLGPAQPVQLQEAAVRVLLSFTNESEVAEQLIARWATLSPAVRKQAVDGLLTRPRWTMQVLLALKQGTIKPADFEAAQIRWLVQHPSAEIRELAQQVVSTESDRAKVVEKYLPALGRTGDRTKGRQVYTEKCSNCHQLGNVGHAVGPSLASMRNRGPEAILVNVLDPNREINPQYLSYIVETVDGRQVAGMVTAETANSITLQQAEGKTEIILRTDIAEMSSTGMSLMPEGLEREISLEAMGDLLSFLMQEDGE